MIWGYAGPWYGEFELSGDDPLMGRLQFLVRHRLRATHIGLNEIGSMGEQQRDEVAAYLSANDLHLVPVFSFDFLSEDEDDVRARTDRIIETLGSSIGWLRAPIVTTCVGRYHRFMREPSLQEQMDRLPVVFAPLAHACHELGADLGIENHGDYYCEELVALCEATPHLGIFLDTGNTYLIGEQSLPGIRAAAPYAIGAHFKDHHVWPEKETYPLRFEIGGAVLGEGDVGLAEAYDILLADAPDPDALVMLLEMIVPRPMDPPTCLDRSLAFINSLGIGGQLG